MSPATHKRAMPPSSPTTPEARPAHSTENENLDRALASGAAPEAAPVAPPKLGGASTIFGMVLTLGTLAFLLTRIDLAAVLGELEQANLPLVLLGMAAHYATYPVRGLRWKRALSHMDHGGSWGRFALIVFFFNFVDNLVPAKLGDVYGAHLVRINLGLRRSAALGSMVFLRMMDSWLIVALAAVSSWSLFSDQLPQTVLYALLIGVVAAAVASLVIVMFVFMHKLPLMRLTEAWRTRVDAFRAGMWPAREQYAVLAALTLLVWLLETIWIWCLVLAFGYTPSLSETLFLSMIPLLASAFPLTPSGAGVVEVTLFGCLRAVGVAAVPAASITVLNRIIDFWLHIALGLVAWGLRDRLQLRTWREGTTPPARPSTPRNAPRTAPR